MNPIYLAIPTIIAAVLAIACGVLYSTILRRDSQLEAEQRHRLTNRKLYETELEVSKKLEADLDQADKAYDLLVKDNRDLTKELEATKRKRNDKGRYVSKLN